MKNLKISAKIALGFGVVLALTLALTVTVVITNTLSNSALADLSNINNFEIHANEFDVAFSDARIASAVMLYDLNTEEFNTTMRYYEASRAILTDMRGYAVGDRIFDEYVAELDELLGRLSAWQQYIERLEGLNRRACQLRSQFGALEERAIDASIHVGEMQLQNLQNDINNNAAQDALLRRHSRVSNAMEIRMELSYLTAAIASVFDSLDAADVPAIRAAAPTLYAAIDLYVANSTQQHDIAAGEAVRTAFNEIMYGLDEFVDVLEQRNALSAETDEFADRLVDYINGVLDTVTVRLLDSLQTAQNLAGLALALAIVMGLAALVIGVFVAIGIVHAISAPVNRLVQLVGDVSAGNLNVNIDRKNLSSDEIGTLTRDMAGLVDVIKSMVDDLDKFAYENKVVGDIEYRIDPNKYQGAYRKMILSLNEQVDDFTDGVVMLLGCIGNINQGNFRTELRTLPGKKIVLNQAADALMANLSNVSTEISAMIDAAANKGDLSYKIDDTKYEGEWRDIMDGLNSIAAAVDAPIVEIRDVINRLGKEGLIDKRVEGSYTGNFLEIKKAVNNTMENLSDVIGDVSETLAAVASGDLTVSITDDYPGDFSSIKESINNICGSLNKTMSEISTASAQVLSGAKQISNSAMELANGASTQASSVEELNASIDMINAQTRQNAQSAGEADSLSAKSADNASEGNDAMKQMLDAMLQIRESSNNISRIIKVIQDIAFQTNLLSLNAAVEAARAGEHGKGFSVVAEEVRNLAARSQTAATETTTLIEDSINRVEVGSGIAETTSESLDTIVKNVSEVSSIINSISSASLEQAEAIEQVSQGLGQISQVVQSNSAVSEETASASEELTSQAEILQQLVSYFRI